jgi:hypothetical protein
MSDRLRSRGHALAACSYLALSFLFAVDEQIFPSVLFGIAAIGAFDAAMYVYEVRTGDRQDPRVAELAEALAKVRPDAEAAVNRSAELAAEYLERALRAEAAIDRIRAIKKAPDRSPFNTHSNAQDDGWDQALDEVRAALDAPVTEDAERASGHLERALNAEAAVTRADQLAATWRRDDRLPAVLSIAEAVSDLREALHPTPEPLPCTCTFSERCAQCPPEPELAEDVDQEQDEPGPEVPDDATEDTEDVEHRALAGQRQPGYDAVYAYIRALPGERSRLEDVVRNAQIWRAVEAALDALNVGRCVSSHCVENDHIIPVSTELGEAAP